jgi:ubiquitin C-terminal hydrolase
MTADPVWIKISTRVDRNATPIVSVSSHEIVNGEERYMNDFMVQMEDAVFTEENLYRHNNQTYMRRRLVKRVEESDYLVFNIHRNHYHARGMRKLRTPVVPVMKIGDLNLHAIVIHEGGAGGGHYTAYFKCKGVWFYYDDVPNIIRRVGTYDDMLRARPNAKTNGVQYFYT